MTRDQDKESQQSEGYRDWSHDLSKLQNIGEEILEEWREDNPNSPRDYPTVQWLVNNGYSHLRWILDNKHDMGTPEFFILFTDSGKTEEYEWDLNDIATIERLETYLNEKTEYRDWAESTKRTQRSRINELLRRFSVEYGNDSILEIGNDPEIKTEVYDCFKFVIKDLREVLTSDNSTHQYVRATHRFLEWLARSDRIEYDPIEKIENEFRWDWDSESEPLSSDQVRTLWKVAENDEERILVIGYCVWGVRTKELPGIHVNQINLDPDDPHIDFNESDRKNGAGQVSLIFGLDSLASLVEKRAQNPDWDGYLFPSGETGKQSLGARTMRRKFKDLCKKAGIKLDGSCGTPKNGRSFYYNIMSDAETDLLEKSREFAEDEGGKDAVAVRDFYLSDERQRHYRHVFFRQRIRRILPDDCCTQYSKQTNFDISFEEFE